MRLNLTYMRAELPDALWDELKAETRPEDWEETGIDLTEFVSAVHAMKAAVPALNREGHQRRITAPDNPVVGLLRLNGGHPDRIRQLRHHPAQSRPKEITSGFDRALAGGDRRDVRSLRRRDSAGDAPLFPSRGRDHAGAARGAGLPRRPQPVVRSRSQLKRLSVRQARTPRWMSWRPTALPSSGSIRSSMAAASRSSGSSATCSRSGPTSSRDGHDKIAAALKYRHDDERIGGSADGASSTTTAGSGASRSPGMPLSLHDRGLARPVRQLARRGHQEARRRAGSAPGAGRRPTSWCRRPPPGAGALRETLEALLTHAETLRERPDGSWPTCCWRTRSHMAVVRCADRTNVSRYPRELGVVVDRQAARFAAWYEMFPRSQSGSTGPRRHLRRLIARLPDVATMGFDVLYLAADPPDRPDQPQGPQQQPDRRARATPAAPTPSAPRKAATPRSIPSSARSRISARFVAAAHAHGLEIALDFAIQCSPDHPWVKEHPEWFDCRPDGTIKYAENPPKKYQDIVNVDFYRDADPAVWNELRDVVLFWIEQGVKTFRVDNPHTKPLPFWEWMIGEVQAAASRRDLPVGGLHPAEDDEAPGQGWASRQSYTYFTWRNTKRELIEYLTELTQDGAEGVLSGRTSSPTRRTSSRFTCRRAAARRSASALVLAATLSSVYGIYNGFELCEAAAIPGKEEYLHSEKYEIKVWDWDRPGNIKRDITQLNRIRRDNPALHQLTQPALLQRLQRSDPALRQDDRRPDNIVLVAVNLDPHQAHRGDFEVPLWEFGLPTMRRSSRGAADRRRASAGAARSSTCSSIPHANPCAIWRLTPMEAQS